MTVCGGVEEVSEVVVDWDGECSGEVGDGGLWVVEEGLLWRRTWLGMCEFDVAYVVERAVEELFLDGFLQFSWSIELLGGGEWPLAGGHYCQPAKHSK